MTAPIWAAMPPEALSGMLSSGPGPGPLLAAADAWSTLSAQYASAAAELSAVVSDVQIGAWQGPSAEQYATANTPYLNWLYDNAAHGAQVAATHEATAAAYTSALAAMPTPVELAANKVALSVLMGTNFLGINTIPIAVNEADYARMWVQAATTMTVYQASSDAVLAAMPASAPAPSILAADVPAAAQPAASGQPDLLKELEEFLTNFQLKLAQVIQQYINEFASPVSYDLNPNGFPIDKLAFVDGLETFFADYLPFLNPTLASTLAWATFHTSMVIWPIAQTVAELSVVGTIVAAGPAAAVLAAAGGTATALGVVGAAVPHPLDVPALSAPPVTATVPSAPVGSSVSPTVPAGAHAAAPQAPSLTSTPSGPGTPAGTPPGGGPAVGTGPTSSMYAVGAAQSSAQNRLSARRSRSLRESAPADEIDEAAVAATAAAKKTRLRRRRGGTVQDRSYRYEYLDADHSTAADGPIGSSGQGAGRLGGPAAKSVEPVGITVAAGLNAPMLPSNWSGGSAPTEHATTTLPSGESFPLEGN